MHPDTFKKLRLETGLDQGQLAHEMGVSRNTVWRMENGRISICRRTQLALFYLVAHTQTARVSPTKHAGGDQSGGSTRRYLID